MSNMATECRTIARTLPAGVDLVVVVEAQRGGARIRTRVDYDPALVKSVRIVGNRIDGTPPEKR